MCGHDGHSPHAPPGHGAPAAGAADAPIQRCVWKRVGKVCLRVERVGGELESVIVALNFGCHSRLQGSVGVVMGSTLFK